MEEQALAAQALALSQHGQSPMSLAPIPCLSQCSIAAIGFAIAAATGVTASEKPINTANMMRSQGTVRLALLNNKMGQNPYKVNAQLG